MIPGAARAAQPDPGLAQHLQRGVGRRGHAVRGGLPAALQARVRGAQRHHADAAHD